MHACANCWLPVSARTRSRKWGVYRCALTFVQWSRASRQTCRCGKGACRWRGATRRGREPRFRAHYAASLSLRGAASSASRSHAHIIRVLRRAAPDERACACETSARDWPSGRLAAWLRPRRWPSRLSTRQSTQMRHGHTPGLLSKRQTNRSDGLASQSPRSVPSCQRPFH